MCSSATPSSVATATAAKAFRMLCRPGNGSRTLSSPWSGRRAVKLQHTPRASTSKAR